MEQNQPLKINLTLRDGAQSNLGTKMSPAEFANAFPNAKKYGVESIQTGGGTFWNQFMFSGHDPEAANRTIGAHFKGLDLTALYRGEFGLSTKRQPLDIHDRTMRILSESGIKTLQNFHGMNDARMMAFVPKMAADHGMSAMGSICVQVNPDTKARQQEVLDDMYRFAEEILKQGHKGLYVKSASGVLTPDFTHDLIAGLKQRFAQPVTLHTHDTYGSAASNIIAATKAGLDAVDVLPDAFGGGTAQISLGHLLHFMKNSGDPAVLARMPKVNLDAINQDAGPMYELRTRYRANEMRYDPHALKLAEQASSAGGAIGVIKGMEGLRKGLSDALGTQDWDVLRDELYRMKTKVRAALGYPTNVTPYELMMDLQSAQSVVSVAKGKDFMHTLHPMAIQYLTGQWGRVSPTVDPEVQRRALEMFGAKEPVTLQPIQEIPSGLEAAKTKLAEQEYLDRDLVSWKPVTNPTDAEAHMWAMAGAQFTVSDPAANMIMSSRMGSKKQFMPPTLPQMEQGERLAPVAALICEALHKSLEAQRLKDGFYRDVQGADGLAAELQQSVQSILSDRIPAALKAAGREKNALGRALVSVNTQITNLSQEYGIRNENVPQIPLNFSFKTMDEFIELVGLDSIATGAEHMLHEANDKFDELVTQVEDRILSVTQIPAQVDAALEMFYKRVKVEAQKLKDTLLDNNDTPRPQA